jgi:DNA-directed RNA polymerase
VNRKVIKQTVMTSVYGVTARGAKDQVQARLLERLVNETKTLVTPEIESDIASASSYVAANTLNALTEMFSSAKAIMDWLANCATLVASEGQTMSWITPLGLPVVQPYRQSCKKVVRTLLQMVILAIESEDLPVSSRKQRSAFPPNFVHSLGNSHQI